MKRTTLPMVVAAGLLAGTSAWAQGDVVLTNAQHQNTTNRSIFVIGFCNATLAPKDLEGWVGQASANRLIASLSGTGREAITIVVPPMWYYNIKVVVPTGGNCTATSWKQS